MHYGQIWVRDHAGRTGLETGSPRTRALSHRGRAAAGRGCRCRARGPGHRGPRGAGAPPSPARGTARCRRCGRRCSAFPACARPPVFNGSGYEHRTASPEGSTSASATACITTRSRPQGIAACLCEPSDPPAVVGRPVAARSASTTGRRGRRTQYESSTQFLRRRYVSRELRRSSSQPFTVRIEREAGVPLVVHGLNRRGTEQLILLVEHFDALRKRDATEIHKRGDKAS